MKTLYINKGQKVSWGEDYHAMAINQETLISHITDVMEHDSILRISKDYSLDGNAEKVEEKDVSAHLIDDRLSCNFKVDFALYSTQGHYLIGYVGHFDEFGL